jgi:prepilin signal peptidase PulO-like enzyme (type II secretory pathway)
MIVAVLIVLGLCLGSFVNALVWRVHQRSKNPRKTKALSIISGRSMCPHCQHELAVKDLVPILSWLWLKGRCRYCKKPISPQYPIVELALALVFILSYQFWPQPLHHGQVVLLATWLVCSVGLMALLLYDLKWMLLPSKIIYPTLLLAVVGQLIYLVGYANNKPHAILNWVLSILVASGLFFILFSLSKGRWIGFGDVRLGLLTGTLLQTPSKSLLMIFIASLLGTVLAVPLIAAGKKSLSGRIPYGPFLITATFVVLLFGDSLINSYKNLLGY